MVQQFMHESGGGEPSQAPSAIVAHAGRSLPAEQVDDACNGCKDERPADDVGGDQALAPTVPERVQRFKP